MTELSGLSFSFQIGHWPPYLMNLLSPKLIPTVLSITRTVPNPELFNIEASALAIELPHFPLKDRGTFD